MTKNIMLGSDVEVCGDNVGRDERCPSCAAKDTRIRELEGADAMVRAIEEVFPNWKNFRDLTECIRFELDELARAGQEKDCLIIDNERLRESNEAIRKAARIWEQNAEDIEMHRNDIEDKLAASEARVAMLEKVVEVAARRPNKLGVNFVIWATNMDAALDALKEG